MGPALATEAEVTANFGAASATPSPTAQVPPTITATALAYASGCLRAQRGSLRYKLSENRPLVAATPQTLYGPIQVFDGYISQCDAYLQTASLPATKTVSAGLAAVTASAARANIDCSPGFCFNAGDVRKPADLVSITNPPTGTGTSSSSTATNGVGGGNRFTLNACSLMFTGLAVVFALIPHEIT
ncbi:MAG: hypothetical protein Q9186_007012 [Xanthomendoza sp. 1 TL-2023]